MCLSHSSWYTEYLEVWKTCTLHDRGKQLMPCNIATTNKERRDQFTPSGLFSVNDVASGNTVTACSSVPRSWGSWPARPSNVTWFIPGKQCQQLQIRDYHAADDAGSIDSTKHKITVRRLLSCIFFLSLMWSWLISSNQTRRDKLSYRSKCRKK